MSLASRFFGLAPFAGGFQPLRAPILSGPMAGAAGGQLAAAVTLGGGLGFCGAGMWSAEKLRSELVIARDVLGLTRDSPELVYEKVKVKGAAEGHTGAAIVASAVEKRGCATSEAAQSSGRLPVGVGLLVWRLSLLNQGKLPSSDEPPQTSQAHELVYTLAQQRPASAWFSFGSSMHETEAWVGYLRHWDALLAGSSHSTGPHTSRIRIIIGIGTLEEAEDALKSIQPDALAVTGNEGGGHGVAVSPRTKELLAQVQSIVRLLGPRAPLLFAAGGLATGRDGAGFLKQGADGVVYGTRYILTPESTYSAVQKNLLLHAGSETSPSDQGQAFLDQEGPTIRSYAFDYARGSTSWPAGVDGRGLVSRTVEEFDPAHPEKVNQGYDASDPQRVVTWAGTGIKRISRIVPAAELTENLAYELDQFSRL